MILGAQIYSVRTFAKTPEGYLQAMEKLKESGYETVQHAGVPLGDAALLRSMTRQAGLRQICPNIDAQPLMENVDKLIEDVKLLGCDSVMLPYITPDDFSTLESFRQAWAPMEDSIGKLQEAGITPVYHNHDFDVAPLFDWDGSFVDWLLENRPGWKFILDVCWAEFARTDVLGYFDKIGNRMECVHFKDYTGGINARHVPVFCACGAGRVDLPAYAQKVKEMGIENVVVEQDNAIAYPDPFGQMAQSAACLKNLF